MKIKKINSQIENIYKDKENYVLDSSKKKYISRKLKKLNQIRIKIKNRKYSKSAQYIKLRIILLKLIKQQKNNNKKILEKIKKIQKYIKDCKYVNYRLCLLGEKSIVSDYLQENHYNGKPFIYFDNNSLQIKYPFLKKNMIKIIKYINFLLANPLNGFNINNLGIVSLGLIPKIDNTSLSEKSYKLKKWKDIDVFVSKKNNTELVKSDN